MSLIARDDVNQQADTFSIGQVGHQAIKKSSGCGPSDATSETDCVVKIVSLPLYLDWIDSIRRRMCDVLFGLVAPKNHVDDATFSNACFTEEDDIWNGSLRDLMRPVIFDLKKMATTLLRITALITSSPSEVEKPFARRL
jgi:hypothetical protein